MFMKYTFCFTPDLLRLIQWVFGDTGIELHCERTTVTSAQPSVPSIFNRDMIFIDDGCCCYLVESMMRKDCPSSSRYRVIGMSIFFDMKSLRAAGD